MPYSAEISRTNPTIFVFLIDQSASMSQQWGDSGLSIADLLSDIVNKQLQGLMSQATRDAGGKGPRDYYQIAVLGYSDQDNGAPLVRDLMAELSPSASPLRWADEIYQIARKEVRNKKVSDGAGGFNTTPYDFLTWIKPFSCGGTPTAEAMDYVHSLLHAWCRDHHSRTYPPTVIHVTDGEPDDVVAALEAAENLKLLRTDDGNLCLFNVHITRSGNTKSFRFVSDSASLPSPLAKALFQMSSPLTPYAATSAGVREGAKAYGYNVHLEDLGDFFDVGTRVEGKIARQ